MLFASLRTGVSVLALLGAAAASAQSTPPETTPTQEVADEAVPGDIVVTARLRGESLQDVPISIAAFSETAIERMQINSLDRLSFDCDATRRLEYVLSNQPINVVILFVFLRTQ